MNPFKKMGFGASKPHLRNTSNVSYSLTRSTFKALSPFGDDAISNLTLSPSLRTRYPSPTMSA